jgi:hypothetical protein
MCQVPSVMRAELASAEAAPAGAASADALPSKRLPDCKLTSRWLEGKATRYQVLTWGRLAAPPLRPAERASSLVHSWAVPCLCAARPPLLAISRCLWGSIEANPRPRPLRSDTMKTLFFLCQRRYLPLALQGDPVLPRSTACWSHPVLVWPPIRSADAVRSRADRLTRPRVSLLETLRTPAEE